MSAGGRTQGKPSKPSKARAPKCPICGKPVLSDYRPFCSKPCADIDLGRWLGGRYVVPGEAARSEPDDEEDEDRS